MKSAGPDSSEEHSGCGSRWSGHARFASRSGDAAVWFLTGLAGFAGWFRTGRAQAGILSILLILSKFRGPSPCAHGCIFATAGLNRSNSTMKRRIRMLACGLGLAVPGFVGFFVLAEAVPADKLARISAGMTQTEVEANVGRPEVIRNESGGSTTFCYGGFPRLRWCSVEIRFGADGRVSGSVIHDH